MQLIGPAAGQRLPSRAPCPGGPGSTLLPAAQVTRLSPAAAEPQQGSALEGSASKGSCPCLTQTLGVWELIAARQLALQPPMLWQSAAQHIWRPRTARCGMQQIGMTAISTPPQHRSSKPCHAVPLPQALLLQWTAWDSCPHMRLAGSQQALTTHKGRPLAARRLHVLRSHRQRMTTRLQTQPRCAAVASLTPPHQPIPHGYATLHGVESSILSVLHATWQV